MLFQCLTLDGWIDMVQELSQASYAPDWWKFVGSGNAWTAIVWGFFLFVIVIGGIGLLNFLTAVFVDAVNEMSHAEVPPTGIQTRPLPKP